MPRQTAVPAYKLHKPTNQAYVYYQGKRIYLGRYDTPASRAKYAEVLQGLTAGSPATDSTPAKPTTITVNDLCLKFAVDRLPTYVTTDGKPSKERDCFAGAIRLLREHFGEVPVTNFGPLALRTVRQAMIDRG